MAKQKNPKGQGYYYKQGDYYYWRLVRDSKTIVRSARTSKELEVKVKAVQRSGGANDKTLVSDYFESWLSEVKDLNDGNTYDQYESLYRIHIKPIIGSYRVSSIKPADIRKVIAKMNTRVVERKNKKGEVTSSYVGMSEKTMRHVRFIMNLVFVRAFEEDKIISENPVNNLSIPKQQTKKQKVLTIDELVKYFNSISKSRWRWSVWFDLVSGLRRGEITSIRSTDFDWENKRIAINKSNSVGGLGATKERKEDYTYLTNIAQYFLDKQFEMLKAEMNPAILNDDGSMKSGYKDEDFLIFPTERGMMVSPNTYYHMISGFGKKVGVKAFPHCFRHSFTYYVKNKVSLKELQNLLRHEASTSTLDIYGNMIKDINEETISKVDDVFTEVRAAIEQASERSKKVINLADRRKAK
jgi:integrase